jgi:hypothetical protein
MVAAQVTQVVETSLCSSCRCCPRRWRSSGSGLLSSRRLHPRGLSRTALSGRPPAFRRTGPRLRKLATARRPPDRRRERAPPCPPRSRRQTRREGAASGNLSATTVHLRNCATAQGRTLVLMTLTATGPITRARSQCGAWNVALVYIHCDGRKTSSEGGNVPVAQSGRKGQPRARARDVAATERRRGAKRRFSGRARGGLEWRAEGKRRRFGQRATKKQEHEALLGGDVARGNERSAACRVVRGRCGARASARGDVGTCERGGGRRPSPGLRFDSIAPSPARSGHSAAPQTDARRPHLAQCRQS